MVEAHIINDASNGRIHIRFSVISRECFGYTLYMFRLAQRLFPEFCCFTPFSQRVAQLVETLATGGYDKRTKLPSDLFSFTVPEV